MVTGTITQQARGMDSQSGCMPHLSQTHQEGRLLSEPPKQRGVQCGAVEDFVNTRSPHTENGAQVPLPGAGQLTALRRAATSVSSMEMYSAAGTDIAPLSLCHRSTSPCRVRKAPSNDHFHAAMHC